MVVGPAAGAEGQDFVINFATVHGSQSHQGSVGDGDVSLAKLFVHHLMAG
jgi:hypothetical protein